MKIKINCLFGSSIIATVSPKQSIVEQRTHVHIYTNVCTFNHITVLSPNSMKLEPFATNTIRISFGFYMAVYFMFARVTSDIQVNPGVPLDGFISCQASI